MSAALAEVTGAVAWGAAGFEFGGDRVFCLVVGRVVVEFEQVGRLTVNALVVVGFHDDPLLPRRRVPAAV